MGRKSKLTEQQWLEVEKRMVSGEAVRKIAREFGISEAAVRNRKSTQVAEIKSVAHQLVSAEAALRELPIAAQICALSLADELRAISAHLAGAAKFGSATAHRLAGVAHAKVQELDDAEPDMETLRQVAALTELANKSAATGLNLLAANKDGLREAEAAARQKSIPDSLEAFYGKRSG